LDRQGGCFLTGFVRDFFKFNRREAPAVKPAVLADESKNHFSRENAGRRFF
jgi:hypothetical protein